MANKPGGIGAGRGIAAVGISIGGLIFLIVVVIVRALTGEDVAYLFEEIPLAPAGGVNNVGQPGDGELIVLAPAWYEIYFTDPTCPPEAARQGGLDETIAADIAQAQFQVDVAAFDFDSVPMLEALITLEQGPADVIVRVVTDEDNGSLSAINRLRRNGISVVEDKRTALMHNKFVIIDQRFLWVGSMNFTTNGVYCNNNNLVRFDWPELAANYSAEMDEMYDSRQFGPTSPDDTPHKLLEIDGVQVENYFASEEEIDVIIAERIAAARSKIQFMAFSFTNDIICEAIVAQVEAGITVRGVFENVGSDTIYSYHPRLARLRANWPNLDVRTDGNSRIMHHKVIIIDEAIVIFGSYNFSVNANDSNDENVLIIHDPIFAAYFMEEFDEVWAEAGP